MAIGLNYQARAVTDGRTVQNATNSETTSPQKIHPEWGDTLPHLSLKFQLPQNFC